MPRRVERRYRSINPIGICHSRTVNENYSGFNPVTVFDRGPYAYRGSQVTDSEGHQWPLTKGGPLKDVGGDFFTQKKYIATPKVFPFVKHVFLQSSAPLIRNTYEGHIFPQLPGFSEHADTLQYPPSLALSASEMDAYGATAIARCKPGDPYMDISTTLGELYKDGLPAIPGVSLLAGKVKQLLGKSSSEYLSYQFGFAPLRDDIRKFAGLVLDAESKLKQFERDAGRVVRRSYRFPIEQDSSDGPTTNVVLHPGWMNDLSAADPLKNLLLGKVWRQREVFRRVWFSGAFTYALPPNWNSASELKELAARANQLIGLELTPETLWNLAPWSWAIDWFSNTGDIVSNASSFLSNGLVMHYGYVMVHTIITDTYRHVYETPSSVSRPRVPEVALVTETKQRKEANPFGFGVSWDGLTPYQLSIAAALGISRK